MLNKYTFLILVLVFVGSTLSAQHLVNNNAQIKIKSGTTFKFVHLKNQGSSAQFITSSPLNISGNFINTSSADFSQSSGVSITFDGSSSQQVTSGGASFGNLVINNTGSGSNQIELQDNLQIDGQLALTDGIINTNSNRLIFENTASYSGGSSNSFIDGEMQYSGSGDFTYPCGDIISRDLDGDNVDEDYSIYSPIKFAPASGTPTNVVEYNFDEPTHDWWEHGDNMDETLHHVSSREWWDINSTGNLGPVTLNYQDNSHASGEPCPHGVCHADIPSNFLSTDLSIAVWVDGQGWKDLGVGNFTGNHDAASITSSESLPTGAKAGQYIVTIGAKTDYTPLPVEMLSFTGECYVDYVSLEWATASELNNDKFIIERSADLQQFESIAEIEGNGNSNEVINYYYNDYSPLKTLSYYRLKQIDFDGSFKYSDVVAVYCDQKATSPILSVFPNPAKDYLNIVGNFMPDEDVVIEMISVTGQVLVSMKVSTVEQAFRYTFDVSSLAPAMYFIRVRSGKYLESYKIRVE